LVISTIGFGGIIINKKRIAKNTPLDKNEGEGKVVDYIREKTRNPRKAYWTTLGYELLKSRNK